MSAGEDWLKQIGEHCVKIRDTTCASSLSIIVAYALKIQWFSNYETNICEEST